MKSGMMDRPWQFEDGAYRQPVVVDGEPQPVWVGIWTKYVYAPPSEWHVAIRLYPDADGWTMGLFSISKGRFLLKNEYEDPAEDSPEQPVGELSARRARSIEKGVADYLQKHPTKVQELIKLECRLMRRWRQHLRERGWLAAPQSSEADA
jgi:hypothetical protein